MEITGGQFAQIGHTIYARTSRWSKSDVLDRVFAELQQAQVVRIKIDAPAGRALLGRPTAASVDGPGLRP